MQFFNEEKHDIEGYINNLMTLKGTLEADTLSFMLNHSFHDSVVNSITVLNPQDFDQANDTEKSNVSVSIKLTNWDDKRYELVWENVMVYTVDFDISRNKIIENGQILFERGLDQWSHDELIQLPNGSLRHEIYLFSKTTILIECQVFSIQSI